MNEEKNKDEDTTLDTDEEILESAEDDGDNDRDPDPKPDDPRAIPKDEGDADAANKGEGKR